MSIIISSPGLGGGGPTANVVITSPIGQQTMAASVGVVIASNQSAVPITATQLPAALVGGRLDENVGAWLGSTAPTVGQKTMVASLPVAISSDQSTLPVTVSGTVVTSNASVGLTGAAAPTSATEIGGSDGTNLLGVRMKGASTAAGATDPALVVAVSPNNTVAITATQLPAALVGGRLDENMGAWLGSTAPTVGQKTMANSVPVVIASDQGAVTVTGTVTANIGTTNGLALDATLTGGTQRTKITDGTSNAAVKAASTAPVGTDPALVVTLSPNTPTIVTSNASVGATGATAPTSATEIGGSDGTNLQGVRMKAASTAALATDPALVVAISPNNTVPVSSTQLPAALVGGRLDENVGAWLGSTAPTVGQKTSANSIPMVMASDYQLQGVSVPTTTVTTGTNGIPLIKYNATPPTGTDLQLAAFQGDINYNLKTREQYAPLYEDNTNGVAAMQILPLAVATYAYTVVFSTALATNLVIKATPGVIRSISGRIDSTATTATYYLMLWNLAALPANATAVSSGNNLMAPFKIQHTSGTDDRFSFDFTSSGLFGSVGLVLGLSTTEFTQTAAGSFLSATAEYK